MTIDDSFKQPGAIPFKWEVRPGVPKTQHQHAEEIKPKKQLSPPKLTSPSPPFHHHRSAPLSSPQQKLKPPPAAISVFLPPPEPRTGSFRSTPRTRSDRYRFDHPTRIRHECVSPGCFPTPSLKRKDNKSHRRSAYVLKPIPEPDYTSDLETLTRWSLSSRKSFSSFRESPTSSYYSSYESSPRPVKDPEWAGFGLF